MAFKNDLNMELISQSENYSVTNTFFNICLPMKYNRENAQNKNQNNELS